MSGANGGSVKVELAGATLRVDARPARLVSLLRSPAGDPIFTAQAQGGTSHTEAVPAEARQVAFLVDGELAVEASRASDFVALSEPSGRQVVVSFTGEVTVLPAGDGGDRFALGAHEALLVPGDGGGPRVVPSDSLSEADQDEISAAMEAAALAVAMPSADAPADPPTESPAEAPPAVAPSVPAPAPAPASTRAKGAGPAKKGPPTTPRGASAAKRTKKGKRGRPQAQPPAKKASVAAAPTTASASAAAGGAAATPKESKAAKATPVRKPSRSAARASQPPGKGGTGPGRGPDAGPSDRRFIIGALALAVVIAIALGAFALTSDDSDEGNENAGDATTTTTVEATITTAPTATSGAPVAAPTTTVIASTTTAAPATSTAPTAPAAPANYAIEPKSCLQNPDNSITYVATIKNESTIAFDYTIRVVFKDGAASVATADAQVAGIEAGRSVDFTARGTPKQSLLIGGSCTVERVDARPSES